MQMTKTIFLKIIKEIDLAGTIAVELPENEVGTHKVTMAEKNDALYLLAQVKDEEFCVINPAEIVAKRLLAVAYYSLHR